MPYAINEGVRIFYEVVGKGRPVVLHHGFSLDHTSWADPDEDWVSAMQDDFMLILMDARGHGASDKPHDPREYHLKKRAADVVAVLDNLHLEKAHFLGYSMGGWIGFGAACFAPERFLSFILGGATPEDDLLEEPNFLEPLLDKSPQDLIAFIEESFQFTMPQHLQNVMRKNDHAALKASIQSRAIYRMEEILPSVTAPCLIYAGDEDSCYAGAKRASEMMPNGSFISIHGGHLAPNLENMLPAIQQFLKSVAHPVI